MSSRTLIALMATAVVFAVSPTTALARPSAARASHTCPGAHIRAYPYSSGSADAVVCLLNLVRRSNGLRPLRISQALNEAAVEQGRDMVFNGYMSHFSPSRGGLTQRIRATGWLRKAKGWLLGENLGYIRARYNDTPAGIVARWMASPAHRANILNPLFRATGLAVSAGTPVGRAGSTFTSEFGIRRLR
jgi:uncharacterized protein YkwD